MFSYRSNRTLGSLKSVFNVFRGKSSLGVPVSTPKHLQRDEYKHKQWQKKTVSQSCGRCQYRLWQTDRELKANRPDIVIKNKQDKTCLLFDMTIPLKNCQNIKTFKSKSVKECGGWKPPIIPVVIGTLGLTKHDKESTGEIYTTNAE